MINLMQGDCLELMRTIPDGSVDMVLTDPPYGTTVCKWDSVIPKPTPNIRTENMKIRIPAQTGNNMADKHTPSKPFELQPIEYVMSTSILGCHAGVLDDDLFDLLIETQIERLELEEKPTALSD